MPARSRRPPGRRRLLKVTWQRWFARAAVLLTTAAVLGAGWLVLLAPSPAHALVLAAAAVLGGVPAAAGLAVSRRLEHSLLGALVVLPGLLAALVLMGSLVPEDVSPPGAAYGIAAGQGDWVLVYVVVAVPLLFFPDGRLATRGARWLLALILLDAATFMVTAATAPGPFLPPDQDSPHVLGTMPGPLATALSVVTLPGLLVLLAALVVHLVRRYRTGDDQRRHQFRWLSLGAGLLPLTLLATWVSYALLGNAEVVLAVGLTLTYLALPTLIAVAICRPGLFDVDRALVATVVSSILGTGLLTVLTATNVLAGVVLSRRAPAVAVAVTAGIAVLLAPAARRLRTTVDARLYPARRAAFTAVDALRAETLLAAARPEELQQRLREALHDPDFVVGYRTPADGTVVDADGTTVPVRPSTDVTLGAQTHRTPGGRRPALGGADAGDRRPGGAAGRAGPPPARAAPRPPRGRREPGPAAAGGLRGTGPPGARPARRRPAAARRARDGRCAWPSDACRGATTSRASSTRRSPSWVRR